MLDSFELVCFGTCMKVQNRLSILKFGSNEHSVGCYLTSSLHGHIVLLIMAKTGFH